MIIVVRVHFPLLLAVFLLAATGPAAAAEVYRWVDDEGVTHYSATPPPDRDADRVEASNPPADDPEARREAIEDLSGSTRTYIYKKRLERQTRAEEKEWQRERKEFCSQLRDKRQLLATSPQVLDRSEEGARVMSQQEREQKLQAFERQIAEHCGAT